MVVSYHRPTKAIIDTKAIKENVESEISRLPKEKELFAVVKADGYGHGAIATASAALAGGAAGFCVATLDEGMELRRNGFTQPIVVMGIVYPLHMAIASQYDLSLAAANLDWLKETQAELAKGDHQIKLHIKVDTGMGRIGFTKETEVLEAFNLIQADPHTELEGIFTHFATADQADDHYWKEQAEHFKKVLAILPKQPRYVHASNSATALWHHEIGNTIRFGMAMYGLNPSGGELAAPFPLKPAMQLVSAIVQTKQLKPGDRIGYGATYTAQENEWIATVPIGYADGWLRKMQGTHVLVDGQFCEIIGRVCMDQLMIRLPKPYEPGEKVTLIGEDQGEEITMQEIADHLETIHYEVACTLSERIPREYQ